MCEHFGWEYFEEGEVLEFVFLEDQRRRNYVEAQARGHGQYVATCPVCNKELVACRDADGIVVVEN